MLFSSKPVFSPNEKPSKQFGSSRCSFLFAGILGVTGALLIAVGAVLLVYFPAIVQHAINKEIPLTKESRSNKWWQNPPVPLRIEFRFFNITNFHEYVNGLAKASLQEVGPYTYRETWVKKNVSFNNNGTVSYVQHKTYFFDPEMSSGNESDVLTVLNVPMLAASNMFKNSGPILKVVLTTVFAMSEESMVINTTVSNLLWNGYDDAIVKVMREVMPNAPYPHPKFAFFYGKNGSTDGVYNIYTGVDSLANFTVIDKWNGKSSLKMWSGPQCNMINGTAGETFPPNVNSSEPLRVFVSDICRSLSLEYTNRVKHDGIEGLRFEATKYMFANGSVNPDNLCFCPNAAKELCLPSGAVNISVCKWGAPVAISLPHFLMGDPRYQNQVDGLNPNETLHQTYVDVEPTTGTVLDVNVRLQINGIIQRVPNVPYFEKVNNTVLPIFWFTQTAGSSSEIVDMLTLATVTAPVYGKLIYYGLFATGIILVLIGVIYYIVLTKRQKFTA